MADVAPVQGIVPDIASVGTEGRLSGVTFTVKAGPEPQALVPETTIVADPVPTLVIMDDEVEEPNHPVPVTVQT